MPIQISSKLRRALPEDERRDLETYLRDKAGGICALCEARMAEAAEKLEADHIIPTKEGGPDRRDNLQLVHASCNKVRRNYPAIEVRPYLRLRNLFESRNGSVRFDDWTSAQGIKPKPSICAIGKAEVKFEFPDKSRERSPLLKDPKPGGGEWTYVYVKVPIEAIFNDEACQPRSLKLGQVWAIYQDLSENPLHEPPSCRLEGGKRGRGVRLLMFDGQHKTVATAMRGETRVTVKIYLDLQREEAIHLVNSIQAKIKKLPLSPFEYAAKMSDELAGQMAAYAEKYPADELSEEGFIDWLPPGQRRRGKDAFEAGLIERILSSDELELLDFVQRAGQPKTERTLITEGAFRTKVLNTMLHRRPLAQGGDAGQMMRDRELKNIVNALNMLAEAAFVPKRGVKALNGSALERRRRIVYQSSLQYVADLLRRIYGQVLSLETDVAFLEKIPSAREAKAIKQAIARVVEHPVWIADLDDGDRMRAVHEALQKNQDARRAFEDVGLKRGYAVGADDLPSDWKG